MMRLKSDRPWRNVLAAASMLAAIGCAGMPAKPRSIYGPDISESWIERAEKGGPDGGQAEACLALSRKLWERDSIEALRYLRRGALLGDAECCRQYLLRVEDPSFNQAQRAYARLTLERQLRRGPVRTARGEDIRAELYEQLCFAWRYTEPCSSAKAAQVLESLRELGGRPDRVTSSALAPLLGEGEPRPRTSAAVLSDARDVQLYAGESAGESRSWLRVPRAREARRSGEWAVSDANAWAGGSERLFLGANVLAFLVNDREEPSFRGRRLWILNLGESPVYLTSAEVGANNRELVPGREEILPL